MMVSSLFSCVFSFPLSRFLKMVACIVLPLSSLVDWQARLDCFVSVFLFLLLESVAA